MKRGERGFTLIELLIVIVIIGVLAAIAIPKFDFTRRRGYRSALKSDLKNIAVQQDLYYSENFSYAPDLASLSFDPSEGVSVTITEADNKGWAITAGHSGLPGADGCAIYFGDATPAATPGGSTPDRPGLVVCDGP